jgi:anti-anti-sigma regulatory factor
MPNPPPSQVKVARTPTGFCLRVEGRGTMRESRPAAEFVTQSLAASPAPTIVVDASACDHLDSTFLGGLVEMQRRATRAAGAPGFPGPRFVVSAPPDKVRKLLSPTKLDAVLKTTPEPPQVVGDYVTLPAEDPANPDVVRHVMECHRRLAELGGPQKAVFSAIADNLERELKAKGNPNSQV